MNYSGRQGVSVNQTSAKCVETLNLPGGQQQGQVQGDRYSRNSEFVSRLSLKPQSTMETEGLGGRGEGPGNIWGQERGSENIQTVGIHSWKWMAGRHQEDLSHFIWGVGDSGCPAPPPVPFPLVIWDCLTPSLSPPFCLSLSTLTLWPPVRFSLPVLHPLLG